MERRKVSWTGLGALVSTEPCLQWRRPERTGWPSKYRGWVGSFIHRSISFIRLKDGSLTKPTFFRLLFLHFPLSISYNVKNLWTLDEKVSENLVSRKMSKVSTRAINFEAALFGRLPSFPVNPDGVATKGPDPRYNESSLRREMWSSRVKRRTVLEVFSKFLEDYRYKVRFR